MEFQAKWIRTSEDTGGVCPVFRKEWKTEKEVCLCQKISFFQYFNIV